MIQNFRSRGLKSLFEDDNARYLDPNQVGKIKRILDRLDRSTSERGMDVPGYRLHPLRGERAGRWAVTVQGNWRIVFRFEGQNACDVDYLDYH